MASIKNKSGEAYNIPKKGSLGLLALGDQGLEAWRAIKNDRPIALNSKDKKENTAKKPKVVLIGWDAADWKIINPLLDAGKMPNLARLVENGTMGNLATLDPPYSPMLWTSIASGKRAYDHGVLGFSEVSPDGKDVQPVMSTSRKVKAIWNILDDHKLRSHVVGWWPSHPAENISGICISNLYQKSKGKNEKESPIPKGSVSPEFQTSTYAPLRIHPLELTENHLLPFVPDAWKINQQKDRRLMAIAKITAETASLHAAFTHILSNEAYDFAALYLDGIDHYCHGFMKFHPPKRPHISAPDYELFKGVIQAAYRFHDMMLGRILELVDDQTTVMLISDHGFQPDHLRPKDIPKEPAGPAYEHSPYGVFVCMGPGIKKDELTFGANLLDIAPTLLKIFNLPIAEDMEGRVLQDIFEDFTPLKYLNTYEGSDAFCPQVCDSGDAKQLLMDHLVELGYVSDNNDGLASKIIKTKNENDYNLARACIEGGRVNEAIEILKVLIKQNPHTPRYYFRIAICYQMLGKDKYCRDTIEKIRTLNVYQDEVLDVFDGSLLINQGRPKEALIKFQSAEKKISNPHSKIQSQIAQCYIQLNQLQDAKRCLQIELSIDYDDAFCHQLLASCHFKLREYKQAAESSLVALGLNYYDAQNHAVLGRSLYHLGQYNDAAYAMEQCLTIMPKNNSIRQLLMTIYKNELRDTAKYDEHAVRLKSNYQGTIYVVSGLPRSGTSMVMQMLIAGGVTPFVDDKRVADEHNPKGYYEHDLVKKIHLNSNWIPLANHKLIKVVCPLIMHLPLNYKYKVIFIDRSIDEVFNSQQKMIRKDPLHNNKESNKDLRSSLLNVVKKSKIWLQQQKNVETLFINHAAVLLDSKKAAQKMNHFFNGKLQEEQMSDMVHSNLHRTIS